MKQLFLWTNRLQRQSRLGKTEASRTIHVALSPLSPLLFASLALVLSISLLMGYTARANTAAPPPPWSANAQLFPGLGNSAQSEPAIAVAANTVLVSWTDERNSTPDIYARIIGGVAAPLATENVAQTTVDMRVTGPLVTYRQFDSMADLRSDNASSVVVQPDGRAYAVYSTRHEIVLARRATNGTWISRTLVTDERNNWYADARHPSLAANGNNLIVVWQDYRNQNWDIYSARCNGETMTCQNNVKVNDEAVTAEEWQLRPRVALADDGTGMNAVVAWEDFRESGAQVPHVYAAFSSDGGASWGGNARVVSGADASTNPAVTYNGNQAWAVWEQRSGDATAPADIYVSQWNGAWQTPIRVDQAPAHRRAQNPAIAPFPGGIFVAWEDFRNGHANADVYGAWWNGSNWQEAALVQMAGMQTAPALATYNGTLYMAWQDTRNGQPDVFAARWNSNGGGGGGLINVAQVNENAARISQQHSPAIAAASSGDLFLVWRDNRSYRSELLMSQYNQSAQNWSFPVILPTYGDDLYGLMNEPHAIVVDSTRRLHAVWAQNSAHGPNIFHSIYSVSASGNGAWSAVLQVSDPFTSTWDQPPLQPAVAVHGNRLAVAWVSANTSGGWPYVSTVRVSEFDGAQWLPSTVVNTTPTRFDPRPSVAFDDAGNLYVAYGEYSYAGNALRGNIKIAKKLATGGGWTQFRQINSPDTTSNTNWCYHERPRLRAAGSKLHVVWGGCVPWQQAVYYSESADGGNTWLNPSLKLANTVDRDMHSVLSVRNDEVVVVYANDSDPAADASLYKFYSAQLRDGTWYTDTLLSDGATDWQMDTDGAAALTYDLVRNRFLAVFADHRSRGLPQLHIATQGGTPPVAQPTATPGPAPTASPLPPTFNHKVYLPLVRR